MSAYTQQMSSEEFSRRLEQVEKLPFHRYLEISVTRSEPGIGELILHPSERTINAGGVVHGGIIYSLLDAAGYLAMLPVIRDHQNGVTHDMHASVLNAAPVDQPLVFKGFLRKLGKRLAFCDSEAWSGGSLVATGRITKSIIHIG